jgi:hypothetical protein
MNWKKILMIPVLPCIWAWKISANEGLQKSCTADGKIPEALARPVVCATLAIAQYLIVFFVIVKLGSLIGLW